MSWQRVDQSESSQLDCGSLSALPSGDPGVALVRLTLVVMEKRFFVVRLGSLCQSMSSDLAGDMSSCKKPDVRDHLSLPFEHNVHKKRRFGHSIINHLSLRPTGLELPFMMMSHPLIPVNLPPASVTMAMNQMNHLNTIASMAAAAQAQNDTSRLISSVIKVLLLDSLH